MIESTINFIISIIGVFVKFLGDIRVTLYGYTFTLYHFILVSIIILAVTGVAINTLKRAGSRISRKSNSSGSRTSRKSNKDNSD